MLYRFQGGSNDGALASGGLIFDGAGNLYGETAFGGACNNGTVFELSPPASRGAWTETILYSFQYSCNGNDGAEPGGGLVFGRGGALFGTTPFGNTVGIPGGTVFRLSPPAAGHTQWTETVLHSFTSGSDGYNPYSGVTIGSKGNLYGTTATGGGSNGTNCTGTSGCGIVFELSPPTVAGGAWTETILHVFSGGNDGASPFRPPPSFIARIEDTEAKVPLSLKELHASRIQTIAEELHLMEVEYHDRNVQPVHEESKSG